MKYKENGTKNLRHLWSVLCSTSVLDVNTNNLSLNNLIEQLNVNISKDIAEKQKKEKSKGFVITTQLQLVTRIVKKIKNKDIAFEIKLDFINTEGKTLESSPIQKIALKKDVKNVRIRNGIERLLIDKEGTFEISVNIREVGDLNFIEVDRVPIEIILKFD